MRVGRQTKDLYVDYIRYLTERALEFRNLALTMRDPLAAQEFHHLADLCAGKAAALDPHPDPGVRDFAAQRREPAQRYRR